MKKIKNNFYVEGNKGYKKWIIAVEDKNFNIFIALSLVAVVLQVMLADTMIGFIFSLLVMVTSVNITFAAYAIADYKKLVISFAIVMIFLSIFYQNQMITLYGGGA